MCIVCIEVAKGNLSKFEAKKAYQEIVIDPTIDEHVRKALKELEDV